jgi:cytoskeletal protein CcmA (bactofilin family)
MRTPRRLLSALLLGLAAAAPAAALDFVVTNRFVLAADEQADRDTWIQAATIRLDGTAADDLFLVSGAAALPATNGPAAAIVLAGSAENDVWAMGASILITGTILDHARLLGYRTITLDGPVGNSLLAFSPDSIRLGPNARIGGGMSLWADTIVVEGQVHGPSLLRGRAITLTGAFEGPVQLEAQELTIMPGTRIAGDLHYTLPSDLVLPAGVEVGGQVVRVPAAPAPVSLLPHLGWTVQIGLFAGALLAGLMLLALFPLYTAQAVHALESAPWKCALAGFVTCALVPMLCVLLFFTVVGIPLMLALGAFAAVLGYFAKVIVALLLGRRLLRAFGRADPLPAIPVLALGLALLYAVMNVPFPFDLVLWFLLTFVGLGALVLGILERRVPVIVKTPVPPPPMPGRPA